MSGLRRSKRDKLEANYISLAKERSEMVASYDGRLLAMQKALDQYEAPRLFSPETSPRKDALNFIKEERMPHSFPPEYADDPEILAAAVKRTDDSNPEELAARTLRLLISLLKFVALDQRNPRLTASACLLALGADCQSMRAIARAEHVSPEWVSQRTEHIRSLFGLPNNQHNKPANAVAKYRALRLIAPVQRKKKNI